MCMQWEFCELTGGALLSALDMVSLYLQEMLPLFLEVSMNLGQPIAECQHADTPCLFIREIWAHLWESWFVSFSFCSFMNNLSASPLPKESTSWNYCHSLQTWIMYFSCKQAAFSNRNSSASRLGRALWVQTAYRYETWKLITRRKYPGGWNMIRKWLGKD